MPIQFTLQEHVAAPPEAVFAALADLDHWHRWMPNLVRVERVGGPAFQVGTEWRETRTMFGREATEQFRVTGVEPGRALDLFVDGTKGSSRKGEYRFHYDLAPEPGGTTLTVRGEIGGMGPVMEFLGRLFMGPMKKAIARDHQALKAYVEQGARA